MDTLVIAHRGASAYLPEHTLAAKALAHGMGAHYLEQDVVLTHDGIPVVLHDIHLDTTTNVAQLYAGRERADGRFYAIDFTLDEIKRLRVHERTVTDRQGRRQPAYPDRFPAGPALFEVPTLAEEIELINGLDRSRGRRTGLYIEMKAPNWHLAQRADVCAAVIQVLQDAGYDQRPEQVYLQCFDDKTLLHLRNAIKTPLPLIQLIGENAWSEDSEVDYDYLRTPAGLEYIASYAAGIGPWLRQVFLGKDEDGKVQLSTLVEDAHAQGLQVHPYTLRADELPGSVAGFEEMADILVRQAGVDGVFTDFPDLLVQYLERRGTP